MSTMYAITKRMIGGLIALSAFVASPPGIWAQDNSPVVYFGEVDSKTDQSLTLNVTPCQNSKTLQRIAPYKITNSEKASCSDGKQYTRVTVQEGKVVSKPNDPDPTDKKKDVDADKKKNADTDKKKDSDDSSEPKL